MKRWFLAVSLLAMLAFSQCHAGGDARKRFAELEGTWTLVKMELGGKSILEKGERWPPLIIKDGKADFNVKGAPKAAPWQLAKVLNPSKKPKTVTVTYEGKVTFYGIYEVKGNELRVCGDGVDTAMENNPEARRPKEFDSKKGLLLVFKRHKGKR
jgi:uncharacterized protein (TIGR03067 family)